MTIALGDGAEFDRVREIIAVLGDSAGPIGDDTAPVPRGDGTLVVSTDVSVEDVHFRTDWLSMEEIGWRAAAAALSDLAAAAALPAGITVALTVPRDARADDAVAVMRGVGNACRACGTAVLGGDLSSGPTWSVAVTVFGYAVIPMSRRGAGAGDRVWVTGSHGGAHAALREWQAGRAPEGIVREAFTSPLPRLAAARWLAQHGATAMIDLSDGIASDAGHVAAASGVRLEVDIARIPLADGVVAVAERHGVDAAIYGASGGEDYEILCTLPAAFDGVQDCLEATGVQLTCIGVVTSGTGAVMLHAGRAIDVRGFAHRV